jgi:hypothetical protein
MSDAKRIARIKRTLDEAKPSGVNLHQELDQQIDFRSLSTRLLQVIPALILVVLANAFISICTAGVVLIQLLARGYNKDLSLGAAILIAVGVHVYLVWNHKIRNFIKQGVKNE